MWSWLSRLIETCLLFLRRLLQWLRRPVRPRWARACSTSELHRGWAQPKPAWVRREVVKMKALLPDAGCRTIAHCFNRRFAVSRRMTVGKTYVTDTLRREQYAIVVVRRKIKHAVPRWLPRNRTWGLDLAVKTDTQGRGWLILAILDHGSRACLALRALRDKSTHTLLRSVGETIRRFGAPTYLRTDNEAVFTTPWFRLGMWLLGIRHQRTDPGCPWQNGRVERFIGTVKAALSKQAIASSQQLEAVLDGVRTWYNHLRPHQHLQGRTPAEAWAGLHVIAQSSRMTEWMNKWEGVLQEYYADSG